ncbi:MAG: hypothetical protein O6757_05835 [Alphaproteobacteria bacterium]|nr:hypothetical protein [Alphaproteobacteria bacterium]
MNTTVATKEKAKDRRIPQPSERDEVGMNCLWCDTPFERRTTGGSPQRYCSTDCRVAFHLAARRWAEMAVAAGWLTVEELKDADCAAYTLHRGPSSSRLVGQVPANP